MLEPAQLSLRLCRGGAQAATGGTAPAGTSGAARCRAALPSLCTPDQPRTLPCRSVMSRMLHSQDCRQPHLIQEKVPGVGAHCDRCAAIAAGRKLLRRQRCRRQVACTEQV